jgi:predicted dehydrogenase
MPDSEASADMSRRRFLMAGAAPVAAAFAAPGVLESAPPARTGRRDRVRVGIIGAGENVRTVMIPGFRRINDCEIVAVANSSLPSSQRVAAEFGIPKAYANWRELLDDDAVDAVCIGTWPYMHHTLTLAALERGKHVLCQARMANDAREASEMLAASRRHPDLVCQLVPTSTSYRIDNLLRKRIQDGSIGEVLSVEVQRVGTNFADFDGALDWRHSREFSGLNVMNLGSTYESMMRWLGRGDGILAMASLHVPFRRGDTGDLESVGLPDHVDVLYRLANGAQVHMRFSETTGLSAGNQTWIHGTEGTLFADPRQNVFLGRRGDAGLAELPNPVAERATYRVEEEFVNAIRGVEPVTMTTFEVGLHYMEWTEAVYRSARSERVVHLPLA